MRYNGKKIQSITIIAGEWFDKVNGNSYHAGKVLINGEWAFNMPFQYGYGNQYEQTATEMLVEKGIIKLPSSYYSLSRFCREQGIAYDANKSENWKMRELKSSFPASANA